MDYILSKWSCDYEEIYSPKTKLKKKIVKLKTPCWDSDITLLYPYKTLEELKEKVYFTDINTDSIADINKMVKETLLKKGKSILNMSDEQLVSEIIDIPFPAEPNPDNFPLYDMPYYIQTTKKEDILIIQIKIPYGKDHITIGLSFCKMLKIKD